MKSSFQTLGKALVRFGDSSALKRIGRDAFLGCRLAEIMFPDSVEEICDTCFCEMGTLSRITFGESSSLKRIGLGAFRGCRVTEVRIPDSVEEICDKCFYGCSALSNVEFGQSSSLKRIGSRAFARCYRLGKLRIPDCVANESCP